MPDKILKINDLAVEYKNKGKYLRVLEDINLELENGEILALVGESGSGKSTLGKTILRLLPDSARIAEGSIFFKGEDICNFSEKKFNDQIRGQEMAMVIQNPQNALNPVFKVGTQILDVLYFKSKKQKSRKELKKEAVKILKKVGISDPEYRFDEYPHQFSGGMKQRVMLAMAFISNPSLLIADEPTTALDLTVEAQILNLLSNLVDEYKISILYISHDLGVVAGLSDRIAVMYAGKIVEVAQTRELFDHTNHPYTEALLNCLPDYQKTKKLQTIPGQVPDPGNYPAGCNFHPRCSHSFDRCRQEEPRLEEIASNHYSACFLNGL
ncbi:oligopeptide/dipeptide ABC transporter, ATP-binding protein [Halanaerobium saccharolyticum subsp. saccharolyticum DSM 6643]|uniref:Oligopeptide/dipeptide ABC transporter, ATP-binding protein n=1 Tax=Halanaerobium saccharolyticum subsp. saccharolyticum DSM 6643 TaxID=1293054 RepID=M5DYG4_9FIRM|nr:ABC transporter ATP-binding protein [Halanaerobium saccharolyticum]CCU78154.1 oligopeptide/dipeptide ABC transporter, ATP-binding protein [Halanaerobium saccharolyticum subsp. saccharolyticum DSM 6643]